MAAIVNLLHAPHLNGIWFRECFGNHSGRHWVLAHTDHISTAYYGRDVLVKAVTVIAYIDLRGKGVPKRCEHFR